MNKQGYCPRLDAEFLTFCGSAQIKICVLIQARFRLRRLVFFFESYSTSRLANCGTLSHTLRASSKSIPINQYMQPMKALIASLWRSQPHFGVHGLTSALIASFWRSQHLFRKVSQTQVPFRCLRIFPFLVSVILKRSSCLRCFCRSW